MVKRTNAHSANTSQNGIRGGRVSGEDYTYVNDDAAEKENRRQSSNIHHGTTRRESLVQAAREMQSSGGPEKTVPVLANFEQWMKLVKDNKINASNSWNFALIDYFHDMSLLKDGDGINFQKASYTLDGCVKIYTSRIDSVASETGKLLSGLAESAKQKQRVDGEADALDDLDEDDDDEETQSNKKKAERKSKSAKAESTLAKSVASLQIKKLDLELSIDPLFRKMCADFDEGGAKGLLLNSLIINDEGRVVFDGELNKQPKGADYGDGLKPLFVQPEDDEDEETKEQESTEAVNIVPVDIDAIGSQYFPDVESLDNLDVCPSVFRIEAALKDPSLLSTALMKEVEEEKNAGLGEDAGEDDMEGFDLDANFDDFGGAIGFDGDDMDAPHDDISGHAANGSTGGEFFTGNFGRFNLKSVGEDMDILSYFDQTLKKNWAGPEHWKIQRLKAQSTNQSQAKGANDSEVKKTKAPKEAFTIDFLSEENDLDEYTLFAPASTTINMPKAQQKSTNLNLLPDDQHFSSQDLIRLFLKPKGRVFHKLFGSSTGADDQGNMDGEVFASQLGQDPDDEPIANYDANFFQDDGAPGVPDLDGGEFFDDYDGDQQLLPASQGNMVSSRARPEYVNYARTAKKVNVKLLKNNIWDKMDMEEVKEGDSRKFTDVVQELKSVYGGQQLSEISTSFCFICTLHLANEKGLLIEDNENHDELSIKWDPDAANLHDQPITD